MNSTQRLDAGTILWCDLTVPEAESVRDFYGEVVGWIPQGVPMDGYEDYGMVPAAGTHPVAGICHATGPNANLPAQWLIYITVDDCDAAAERCRQQGGTVLDGPRSMGGGRFCVIRDPAGAVCALYTLPEGAGVEEEPEFEIVPETVDDSNDSDDSEGSKGSEGSGEPKEPDEPERPDEPEKSDER